MKNGFAHRLQSQTEEKNSRLCVGLDPRLELLPSFLLDDAKQSFGASCEAACHAIMQFNRGVLDGVAHEAAAVKFQSAFYEQFGVAGIQALSDGIAYAKSLDLLVILDAKRGDIDSTAEAYANAYVGEVNVFGAAMRPFEVDCLTVNPFLGEDSVLPFIETAKKHGTGVFVLVKTSNPGSGDFQGIIGQDSISEKVARMVARHAASGLDSSGYSGIGAVVGATYAKEAKTLRLLMPNSIFLVPGIGTQGGSWEDLPEFFDDNAFGAIINSSRGVVFSFGKQEERQYQAVIAEKAREAKERINSSLKIG